MSDFLLRSILQGNIEAILPHLPDNKVKELVNFLISRGVKKESDLRRFTVPVLQEELDGDLIDASDLFDEWQKKFGSSNSLPVTNPASATQSSSASSAPAKVPPPASQSRAEHGARVVLGSIVIPQRNRPGSNTMPTMPTYDIDSPYLPSDVKKAIKEEKRPTARARERMVERIVDHCRETVPCLQRAMFNSVALSLVNTWPKSFKDTLPISDHGSDSLAKQMRDKFDNDKRPKTRTQTESSAPATKQAYGCINWNPSLEEGDIEEEVQEQKRTFMVETHQLARKEWDWKVIKRNVEDTYYLQRKEINGKLASEKPASRRKRARLDDSDEDPDDDVTFNVVNFRARWPFLFTYNGMNYHFKLLTGVDFRDSFKEFMQEESEVLIEFLACKGEELAKIKRQMVRAQRQGLSCVNIPTLLLMLVKSLKDDLSFMVRYVESTTSFEEVKDTAVQIPMTPILIAAGTTLFDTNKFYLCIDGEPVAVGLTLEDSFGMLFSSFFMLNIEYTEHLSALLTFTQRVIAKINPQKGAKCSSSAITRKANEKVSKTMNKYAEYKQKLEEEENE